MIKSAMLDVMLSSEVVAEEFYDASHHLFVSRMLIVVESSFTLIETSILVYLF